MERLHTSCSLNKRLGKRLGICTSLARLNNSRGGLGCLQAQRELCYVTLHTWAQHKDDSSRAAVSDKRRLKCVNTVHTAATVFRKRVRAALTSRSLSCFVFSTAGPQTHFRSAAQPIRWEPRCDSTTSALLQIWTKAVPAVDSKFHSTAVQHNIFSLSRDTLNILQYSFNMIL